MKTAEQLEQALERGRALEDRLASCERELMVANADLAKEKSRADAMRDLWHETGRAMDEAKAVLRKLDGWARGDVIDLKEVMEIRTEAHHLLKGGPPSETDSRIADAKKLIAYWRTGAMAHFGRSAALTTHPLSLVESVLDGEPVEEFLP